MVRGATQQCSRPMERRDLARIAQMFAAAFRKGRQAPGLEAYLEALCFGSPHLSPDNGSRVFEDESGTVCAAVLSVPMRFRVEGQLVTARLLCNFMAVGGAGPRGAANLSRHFRGKRHDFLFADTALEASTIHWKAGGGRVLPVQSLEWRRLFRPLSAETPRLHRSLRSEAGQMALTPLRLVDAGLRRRYKHLAARMPEGLAVESVGPARFLFEAGPMLGRFSVRPDWDPAEFAWLTRMVESNQRLGPLRYCLVTDAGGATIGAAAYCGSGRGRASVLNLLCLEERERETVAALLADLDRQGYAEARGMTQPFMMPALQAMAHVTFRHRGFFCAGGRLPALHRAIDRDLLYAEGLSSESWSRLLTDF